MKDTEGYTRRDADDPRRCSCGEWLDTDYNSQGDDSEGNATTEIREFCPICDKADLKWEGKY